LYRDSNGRDADCAERTRAQFARGEWEPHGPDGESLDPVPTPESKRPTLASVYALSKYDQERLCLMTGEAYGIPTVALRFFNVYGTRQALSNPYTGVLAIFAARLLNGNAPLVFEDGLQRRDFVSVVDVARACRLALECPQAPGKTFNIGSGESYSVLDIAARMSQVLGKYVEPEVTGKYRVGDIRHCFADISRARGVLGFEPDVSLEQGLTALAAWLEGQQAEDRVAQMQTELTTRGLTV
jgi:dTDP-L-rhamnose 4-epimerase